MGPKQRTTLSVKDSLADAAMLFLQQGLTSITVTDQNELPWGALDRTQVAAALADHVPSYTPIQDILNEVRDASPTVGSDPPIGPTEHLPPPPLEWHTIFNALPYPAVFFSSKGEVQEVNPAFRDKFGFFQTQDRILEQNIGHFLNQITEQIDTRLNEDVKTVYQGKVYWSRMVPVDQHDRTVGSILFLRDMSRVEKAFVELAHVKGLNQQLDRIINASFDGLYITDGQGVTLRLNNAFERITGVTASECLGRNMKDLVKQGYFSRSGTLVALEERRSVTVPLQARTGKNALVTSTPIFDDDHNIVLVVTNVRDMTELVELEQRLEKVEGLRQRELDAIFDSSYDGLYITDGSGTTLRLNQAFERITGVTAAECIGRNMADLVSEGYFSRSGTLLALEQKQSVTVPLQAKTGRQALVTSTPILDDNQNIVMVVTNVRDLSELNQLQQKVEHWETLSKAYHVELQQLRMEHTGKYVFHSQKMRDLMKTIIHVAPVESTVLIQGESGSGKEVVADLLHHYSHRRDMPFIKINCAAIPQNLLESEMFGYEPGAFSGADKRGKMGMFELANRGTLFLDEIAELPLDLQVKLLRVLQDKNVRRIGAGHSVQVDVRIITGTNVNLMEMVEKKLFRSDLFYRCNVVPINVPPLRDRSEDIPVLCGHFLDIFNRKYHMNKQISPEVLEAFLAYDWPGNVRELRNLVERLVVTTIHDLITVNDLASWTKHLPRKESNQELLTLQETLESTERQLLQSAFQRCSTTYEVASLLGISQASVVRKASKYGIIRKTRQRSQ